MWVYEHVLASHYSWRLEDIRQMDTQDFFIHLRICLIREEVEREFQARLAGATFEGDEPPGPDQEEKITDVKRHKSGAVTETKSTRQRLRGEIGSLRMNKKTGEVISYKQPELPE
jgi:hypothetical protein